SLVADWLVDKNGPNDVLADISIITNDDRLFKRIMPCLSPNDVSNALKDSIGKQADKIFELIFPTLGMQERTDINISSLFRYGYVHYNSRPLKILEIMLSANVEIKIFYDTKDILPDVIERGGPSLQFVMANVANISTGILFPSSRPIHPLH